MDKTEEVEEKKGNANSPKRRNIPRFFFFRDSSLYLYTSPNPYKKEKRRPGCWKNCVRKKHRPFSRLLESQGLRYFWPRPFSLHIFKRHILQIHLYSTNIKWDKLNHCFHLIGIFVRITGSDIGGGVRVGNNEGEKKETMEKKREVE